MTKSLQNRLGKVVNIQNILYLFFEMLTYKVHRDANLRIKEEVAYKTKRNKQQQQVKIR